MITKRDINKLRTPEDLERKYNLNDILTLKENYELQKNGLNKVENELNGFVIATGKNLKELQDQVDGNITTWFYSGVPTTSNEPASTWITDTEKNNHLGDLYYDKDTGYAYRYSLDNATYSWIKITDNDVTQALAIANSAKDTADSKRRVFVVQPITPYDVGDLWIKNEELYRCQTTKSKDETFEENDWIIATKYTDDTKANQVGENLTILSGTVTEIKENVDKLETTMTNTTKLVNEQGETIGILETKQSQTEQTVDEMSSSISAVGTRVTTIENSVLKYQTELDIYNITIPVDSEQKPLENKDYLIEYSTKFEGSEVESTVSSQSDNTGITFGLSNNKITLSVLTSTAITSLSNEFVIDFSYIKDGATYTDSKKLVVDLLIVVDEELNDLQNQINNTNKDLNNNYTNNTELNQKLEDQKQTITEEFSTRITQTKSEWQASVIEYINTNGVEKFVNTLVTIDIDGLKLSKSDEDIVSLLNNKGLYVSDGKLREDLSNLLMKVDRAGALFKLLEILGTIKEQGIIQKEKITDETYGECQAWYWIGDE